MNVSVIRTTGRMLLPVTAAALLAGVSLEAGAFDPDVDGDYGRLEFQTGKDLGSFHFRFQKEPTTVGYTQGSWTFWSDLDTQGFVVMKGCTVTTTDKTIPPSGPELARLTGLKGTGTSDLGYVATSLGVYDGPQGTACGRVSSAKSEKILFEVGSAAELGGANAFDRIDLDLEVKGETTLKLEVNFDGNATYYYLVAGAGVDPGSLNNGTIFGPGNPTAGNTFYCRASSDSGPDSGPSDNCRWQIRDVGRSFKIEPIYGEFSWEGGGDFSGEAAKRTHIYLTRIDGFLGCSADPIETSGNGVACEATRLDPPTGDCNPVPYVFRATSDDQRQYCILEADMGTEQLIVNIFTTYEKETQQGLPDGVSDVNGLNAWVSGPLSQIKYDTDTSPYFIPPCLGLTLTNMDLANDVGPDPIQEISTTYDRVGGGLIEFACAFLREESFGSDATSSGYVHWTRIREGIQFWGDPQLSRPGGGSL